MSPLAAATLSPPASVDSTVEVTTDMGASRAHTVRAVAVDPRDDDTLAVADADAYSGQCAVHVSTNAGLSWTLASTPKTPAAYSSCVAPGTGVPNTLEAGADLGQHLVTGQLMTMGGAGVLLDRGHQVVSWWSSATRNSTPQEQRGTGPPCKLPVEAKSIVTHGSSPTTQAS